MNPYLALKASFRDLVDAVGGNVRAAKVSRADGARLSRYGSIHESMHAPIDVVMDLEQEALKAGGEPLGTRALAEHHCFNLVPKAKADTSIDFTAHLGAVAKETGEAISTLGIAIADGHVTPQEATAALGEAREAQRKLACLIEDLDRVASGTPVRLVPRCA